MTRSVEIRQAQRTIQVPEGRTVLEVALEEGLPFPHGCRSGRCGSCKSRLLSGEVDPLPHTPFALSPAERDQGLILACRAQPLTDLKVAWLGKEEETADHPVRHLRTRVVALEDATHDIKRIRLAPEDGSPLTRGVCPRHAAPRSAPDLQ